jgi:Icc-related predicted phosphoesterase
MADTRVFFATDIHGSDRCFRKFLNAAAFYRCDVIVMGGDMTGKMLIPIVPLGGGRYETTLFGRKRTVDEDGLPTLRRQIADAGYYAYDTTPEEIASLQGDEAAVEQLFWRVIGETVERWLRLAEERLAGTQVVCLMAPGNDDPPFVDELLRTSSRVIDPEREVVELPGGFPMISVGYSNITPWDSPREVSEEQLLRMIDLEAAKLDGRDLGRAVFNLHVPPLDSGLDTAVLLDAELRPLMRSGSPVFAGVGSSAVRSAIERHQPMLGLHGHIHESRGEARLGRTISLNPGSEYSEGVLRGVIVTLSAKKGVKGHQLVAG